MRADSNIVAAIIGVGGAIFLALMGNALAFVFFAGRLIQRVQNVENRTSVVETVARDASLAVAELKGRLETA